MYRKRKLSELVHPEDPNPRPPTKEPTSFPNPNFLKPILVEELQRYHELLFEESLQRYHDDRIEAKERFLEDKLEIEKLREEQTKIEREVCVLTALLREKKQRLDDASRDLKELLPAVELFLKHRGDPAGPGWDINLCSEGPPKDKTTEKKCEKKTTTLPPSEEQPWTKTASHTLKAATERKCASEESPEKKSPEQAAKVLLTEENSEKAFQLEAAKKRKRDSSEAIEGMNSSVPPSGLLSSSSSFCKSCGRRPCIAEVEEDLIHKVRGGDNKSKRFKAYGSFSKILRYRARQKLPPCVITKVQKAWPDAEGTYEGFRK
jgi:hypothetical protein